MLFKFDLKNAFGTAKAMQEIYANKKLKPIWWLADLLLSEPGA